MHLRLQSTPQGTHGFTLVEVITTIAIMLTVGGGIIAFQRSLIVNTKILQSALISEQQVRRTLQLFIGEIRGAGASAGGAYAIEAASTSSLTFYANIDKDASIERVRYFLATSTLKKGIVKPTGTTYNLATEKISSIVFDMKNTSSTPVFIYFDKNYNGISSTTPLVSPINIPSIRLIKMSLSVDPNASRSPTFQTYTTQVSLRNLKDNL